MHVQYLAGEDRDDFDEWLASPFPKARKPETAQEAYERAMTRYELGIGPPPQPINVMQEGEVISFGGAR